MWRKIIVYRDFYDIPRMFLVHESGGLILFDCPFNEELDDYAKEYSVYEMKKLREDQLPDDWSSLPRVASRYLGTIAVSRVKFDATNRVMVHVPDLRDLLA